MSTLSELELRSQNNCELCGANTPLEIYEIPPASNGSSDQCVFICQSCKSQVENPETMDTHHWRCLNDSMWSQVPAVQVMAWRMLKRLSSEGWPQELLDMLYLEDDVLKWAKATGEGQESVAEAKHRDSNGVEIFAGDTVTIIKDLNVKGSSLVAKRGTAVRNISLVHNNPEHIEGKVEGQQIVILTKYVKK